MVRRVLSCLLLVTLILQGMAAAGAGVPEFADGQAHCSDHEVAGMDCSCCSETDLLAGGCATSCAAIVAIPASALVATPRVSGTLVSCSDDSFLSAVHPPLDRPPIA